MRSEMTLKQPWPGKGFSTIIALTSWQGIVNTSFMPSQFTQPGIVIYTLVTLIQRIVVIVTDFDYITPIENL